MLIWDVFVLVWSLRGGRLYELGLFQGHITRMVISQCHAGYTIQYLHVITSHYKTNQVFPQSDPFICSYGKECSFILMGYKLYKWGTSKLQANYKWAFLPITAYKFYDCSSLQGWLQHVICFVAVVLYVLSLAFSEKSCLTTSKVAGVDWGSVVVPWHIYMYDILEGWVELYDL